MVRVLLVCLFACRQTTPPMPPANTAVPAPAIDAAPEVTACERHQALDTRARECPALSPEIKQDIEQRGVDMSASISESGLDGSTPVDPEALCEEEIEYLLRVAGGPCNLE